MPVRLDRIEAVAAVVAAIYREGETALLKAITDRLAAGIDRPGWETQRLAAVGALRRQAAAIAVAVSNSGEPELRAAVAAGYRAGRHDAVQDLAALLTRPPGSVPPASAVGPAERQARQAIQALADAVVGEIRPLHSAILPQAESVYRRTVAGAAARKLTGASTMREAAQAAYASLVAQGITGYTDGAQRRWRLHTYAEMSVQTAVHRAGIVGLVDEYTAANVRLVSVDDQPGECVRCRPFEHQVLALWGPTGHLRVEHWRDPGQLVDVHVVATLREAQTAGLHHPRCRHTIRPYFPGVSILLKQGRTADPEGAAARDRQRHLERKLRHWREMEVAALTVEARRTAAAMVRAFDNEMANHITATRLTRLRYREQIGAGIIPAAGKVDARAARLGIPRDPNL